MAFQATIGIAQVDAVILFGGPSRDRHDQAWREQNDRLYEHGVFHDRRRFDDPCQTKTG